MGRRRRPARRAGARARRRPRPAAGASRRSHRQKRLSAGPSVAAWQRERGHRDRRRRGPACAAADHHERGVGPNGPLPSRTTTVTPLGRPHWARPRPVRAARAGVDSRTSISRLGSSARTGCRPARPPAPGAHPGCPRASHHASSPHAGRAALTSRLAFGVRSGSRSRPSAAAQRTAAAGGGVHPRPQLDPRYRCTR